MSRTLTAAATTEKNKTNANPINIIKIEYGGAIGTKYYSDQPLTTPVTTETDYILNWGGVNFSIIENRGETQSTNINILDTSLTILGYTRSQELYKAQVSYYQWFGGTGAPDMILIWVGQIKDVFWKEDPPSVEFAVDNLQSKFEERLGTEALSNDFPGINTQQDGAVIPLVVGKVYRSPAVQIKESKRTSLTVPLRNDGTEAAVLDSREFAQGLPLQNIFIGNELVVGSFDGNLLTIVHREKTTEATVTLAKAPNSRTFKANLTPNGPSHIGKNVKFFMASGILERQITNFTSPDIYGVDSSTGFEPTPGGIHIEVYYPAQDHEAGTEVYESLDEYIWAVNDAVSQEIEKIEMRGSTILTGVQTSEKLRPIETWVGLDESYTTLNLNNSDYVAEIGHNITTISLPFDPKHLQNSPYVDTTIYVTLTGIDAANPVETIVDLGQLFGMTYPTDFDTTSETSVKAAVNWLTWGFTITDKPTWDLLFDLAFQARIALKFVNDKLTFTYLQNKTQAAVKTITNNNKELDTLEIFKQENIFNRIRITFTDNDGKEKEFFLEDTTSQGLYGIRERDIILWAHTSRNYAESIGNFWLRRWAYDWEHVKFFTYLDQIELQRNDWVNLDFAGILATAPAEIIDITQTPGTTEIIDRLAITCRLPKFAGCSSNCEQYEETGCASTCQQVCQTGAETSCNFKCETSAEDACSLTCVLTCELECTTFCQQSSCRISCEGESCRASCTATACTSSSTNTPCNNDCTIFSCTSGCTSSGTTEACSGGCTTDCTDFCTSACTLSCTGACTSDNQACTYSCRVGCQDGGCTSGVQGCSTACETPCTASACQTGAEGCLRDCMTNCQGICTTGGCTATCQGGFTSGTSCFECCQNTNQTGCANVCEAGSCTATCTSACQQAGCIISCTNKVEGECSGSCEGHCEDCCQYDGTETTYSCTTACQTGAQGVCATSCQDLCEQFETGGGSGACQTACQGFCMTAAETGCGTFCTVGCECFCRAQCQAACMTGTCQTNCQCECKTSAQPSPCTTSSEGACYSTCTLSFCQTAAQTGCFSSCEQFCQTDVQTGLACQVGCQCFCQGICEAGCTSGCESDCVCACQSSDEYSCNLGCTSFGQGGVEFCNTSCRHTCTATCQGHCQSIGTTGCFSSCEEWCQTDAQTGCSIYCTVGCQCDCQLICEANCRSGSCEQNCQCFCQTAGCQTSGV